MNEHGAKWIRRSRRLALYLRDAFTCVYCGSSLQLAKPSDITLDHVDPREIFGQPLHINTNLVTACVPCNQGKGSLLLNEWIREPSTLERVQYATLAQVPQILATHILNTAQPTKRRSVWLSAFTYAQRLTRIDSAYVAVFLYDQSPQAQRASLRAGLLTSRSVNVLRQQPTTR